MTGYKTGPIALQTFLLGVAAVCLENKLCEQRKDDEECCGNAMNHLTAKSAGFLWGGGPKSSRG